MNAEFDSILAAINAGRKTDGRGPTGWIMRLGRQTEMTEQFCRDERILDYVGSVVQPGIAIYSAKLVTKDPQDPTECLWHQDDAYYRQNSESSCRMSIWVPLQDTRVEHGCLQVIPGSHKRGLSPASPKPHGTCSLSIDDPIDEENKIYVPMKAGDMLLFSALLWHHSVGNTTDQRRRAFIVSYQEATATGGNADQWQILRTA